MFRDYRGRCTRKLRPEPGFCLYALYDKNHREDILAYAYAQCRSNKGAPGVDRQDFAEVEAYGVERWLGKLVLALREESLLLSGEIIEQIQLVRHAVILVYGFCFSKHLK